MNNVDKHYKLHPHKIVDDESSGIYILLDPYKSFEEGKAAVARFAGKHKSAIFWTTGNAKEQIS